MVTVCHYYFTSDNSTTTTSFTFYKLLDRLPGRPNKPGALKGWLGGRGRAPVTVLAASRYVRHHFLSPPVAPIRQLLTESPWTAHVPAQTHTGMGGVAEWWGKEPHWPLIHPR